MSLIQELKAAASKAVEKPLATFQLVATILVVVFSFSVVGTWLSGGNFNLPLKLFGIVVIALLLTNAGQMGTWVGVAVVLAVLIVGTLVAGEDFIVKIIERVRPVLPSSLSGQ